MCNCPCDETPNLDPVISTGLASKEGSCNFCWRYVDRNGLKEHKVTIVKTQGGGGLVVRFCDLCKAALKRAT